MFHLFEINFIIKVNNIFSLSSLLINHTFCINLCDIVFVLEQVCIFIDDCIESDLLLITNLGNWIDGAHNQLVKVAVHQQLGFARKHWFYNAPDYFLNLFWDLQHLAKFNGCLSRCLKDSPEKEVVRQNFLLIFPLHTLNIRLLFHVIENFDDTWSSFPGKLTNNSDFNFPELSLNLKGHILIEFQEYVQNSP